MPLHQHIHAYQMHKLAAHEAYDAFVGLCGGVAPPRVPGCDTVIRLAIRIHGGRTVEEAAAREYLYRWGLAIKAPDQCGAAGMLSRDPEQRHRDRPACNACCSAFGTPHTIGM